MRGKVAKKLRRIAGVYGRSAATYISMGKIRRKTRSGEEILTDGTVVCTGARKKYKQIKAYYRKTGRTPLGII